MGLPSLDVAYPLDIRLLRTLYEEVLGISAISATSSAEALVFIMRERYALASYSENPRLLKSDSNSDLV